MNQHRRIAPDPESLDSGEHLLECDQHHTLMRVKVRGHNLLRKIDIVVIVSPVGFHRANVSNDAVFRETPPTGRILLVLDLLED